ncbi:hypothetical protein BT96DRAFT_1003610 [Gymnopus androsaceus JB14]|uniref:Uncharacterized protein n=1 Tax=Gymnopus androsaceus JB14 TaxID=1447944 RepID=A0A6A4GUF4_9AGAR|nr:hypothetical protein BT96DRAFT_1003610 [Gymnopus androsaceus JB14]
MPTSIHSWVSASKMIGQFFNNSQPQHQGVPHDYILPEPALFANHKVESSHQAFFKMYLKVHEVLLYDIATCGVIACLRSPKDWRRMLGLELFGQKDTGSLESNKQKRLHANLQSAASASSGPNISMDFDISNLNSIVPAWKDKKYEGSIPDDVYREVLEEIFLKSRDSEEEEVLNDLDASMHEERNIKVIGAVILDTDVLGVASTSVDTRQNAFYDLFKVMNGWTKGPSLPDGSYCAGEKLSEMVSEEDLNHLLCLTNCSLNILPSMFHMDFYFTIIPASAIAFAV